MTHPPAGPAQPPRPSGPRKPIVPLDPNTPEGRAAAEAMSEALGYIKNAVDQRLNARKRHDAA